MPRPTGSAAIATARERCARELRDLGYVVTEQPFTFSSFPGRFATPLFGLANAALVGIAWMWAHDGRRVAPGALLFFGIAVTVIAARWLTRHGVLSAPLLREGGVNLEAMKTGETPRVWLCAHLDSKSQPVPTLIRSVGAVLEATGVLIALVLALAHMNGTAVPESLWALTGAVTLAGAVPVGLSMVGTQSPGALDNASGVATVIAAARRLQDERDVAVLLTDAEEFGLAGARSWSRDRAPVAVLNCDGVDDDGDIVVMRAGRLSARLATALRSVAAPKRAVTIGAHFPGVITDAVAFADAGLDSVTVSRGTVRSFLRVHSLQDDLGRLRGDGIGPTADFIAATTRELLEAGA